MTNSSLPKRIVNFWKNSDVDMMATRFFPAYCPDCHYTELSCHFEVDGTEDSDIYCPKCGSLSQEYQGPVGK